MGTDVSGRRPGVQWSRERHPGRRTPSGGLDTGSPRVQITDSPPRGERATGVAMGAVSPCQQVGW